MKKSNLCLTLAAAAALSLLAPAAQAFDGQIEFTGQVITQTCAPVSGVGSSQTVALADVTAVELASAEYVKQKTFQISLTGCTPSSGGVAVTFNAPTGGVDTDSGQLIIDSGTDKAQNVQIRLFNSAGDKIMVGGDEASQNLKYVNIDAAGTATLDYSAAYVKTGMPVAGQVTSRAEYTVVYE